MAMKVIGTGSGGIDEMRGHLNDDAVQFGLLRFTLGSGTFQRTKLLMVVFKGANVSGIKKARVNTNLGAVKSAVGDVNGQVTIDDREDCSIEHVLTELKTVFVSDNGEFSIESLKRDYQKMVQSSSAAAGASIEAGDGHRLTAIEMGDITADQCMEQIRKPRGPFNWALFKPTPDNKMDFFNGGTLSVEEMREWLKDDEILYGIVRMGFGTGQFRRTKYIATWWRGDNVNPMKRSKLVSLQGESIKKVEPFSCTIFAHELDEITLDVIVKEVRKCAVIDGNDDGGEFDDPFSVEAFLAALDEDTKANAKFFRYAKKTVKKQDQSEQKEYSFEEALKLLRSPDGPLTWGLFELK